MMKGLRRTIFCLPAILIPSCAEKAPVAVQENEGFAVVRQAHTA
jgi:hypothetical protein